MITPYWEVMTKEDGTKVYTSTTNLPTPTELRNRWCFGLPLTKIDGQPMTDEDLLEFIDAAISDVEQRLGVFLKPKVIASNPDSRGLVKGTDYEVEEPAYDYSAFQYKQYGFLQLRERPVQKLNGFKMVLPNLQVIIDFLRDERTSQWVKLYNEAAQLHIVPYAGDPTLFSMLGGTQSGFPFATGSINSNLPQMFYIDYVAGFGLHEVPANIRNVVAKIAAIDVLGIAGDAVQAGVSSQSTSMDGLSESVAYSASATSGTYTSHTLQMQKEVDAFFEKGSARSAYRGITMTGL